MEKTSIIKFFTLYCRSARENTYLVKLMAFINPKLDTTL